MADTPLETGAPNRKPYHSPTFRDYGRVAQLTRTLPGSGLDGGIDDPSDDAS